MFPLIHMVAGYSFKCWYLIPNLILISVSGVTLVAMLMTYVNNDVKFKTIIYQLSHVVAKYLSKYTK